ICDARVMVGALIWAQWRRSVPAWLCTEVARWGVSAGAILRASMAVVAAPIMSRYQGGRAVDWAFFVFAIGVLLSISANRAWIEAEFKSVHALQWIAVVCLAPSLYFSSNVELAR